VIVFDRGDDVILLLTIPATGIGLFGILSFDAAQQNYIMLNKSMPEIMAATPIGEATKNPAQFQFYRATNAIFISLIAVIQVTTIYN
jgi:hypothetical protein|tara:strand:- start:72 stop:332 length:261 start_codon:yes stop_codon:yes gene_type:complete